MTVELPENKKAILNTFSSLRIHHQCNNLYPSVKVITNIQKKKLDALIFQQVNLNVATIRNRTHCLIITILFEIIKIFKYIYCTIQSKIVITQYIIIIYIGVYKIIKIILIVQRFCHKKRHQNDK